MLTRGEAGGLLSAEARRFSARGWMLGTSGNLSLRVEDDPLRFYITASGRDKSELTPDDVTLADAAGTALPEADRPVPPAASAEAGLHARVYRLTGAGAVFHVHSVAAVLASERVAGASGIVFWDLEMLKGIGREAEGDEVRVPIIDNHQDMAVLADRFEAACDVRTPGMLVRHHGLYAWGEDHLAARRHVEIFEWLFEYRSRG